MGDAVFINGLSNRHESITERFKGGTRIRSESRGDPNPSLKGRVKALGLSEPTTGEAIAALTMEAISLPKLQI
jgi:hypothetical protein